MLNSKPEQFKLAEDGQILWQKQAGNPMPGEPVARAVKGEHILKPGVEVIQSDIVADLDKAAVRDFIQNWLNAHIAKVLEDLVALNNTGGMSGETKGIAYQLHESLGIIARENVKDLISTLDPEGRSGLRKMKIKMGPVLIFIYTLTKPAAVRLRALLWSLHHDKALPATVPNDGMVSLRVDVGAVDPVYHSAIGYPVYANRAIRIDMVDRILNAIYDSADGGTFKATHAMAEWLGCSIADLYDVLEAMGHKKISDPADEVVAAEKTPEQDASEKTEVQAENVNPESAPEADKLEIAVAATPAETKPEEQKPQADVKPELATFRLKKGAANSKPRPQSQNETHQNKSYKKPKKGKPAKGKPSDRGPKVMSAQAEKNVSDSPFAILEQLKKSS
jgi:ATP-dependent RNA helicase SUPV3L1/SUV3